VGISTKGPRETMGTELTTTEAKRLSELEKRIKQGLGDARFCLLAIRDEKLYQAKFKSFEAYCKEKWDISRSRAYQLIEAAEVQKNVQKTGQIPNVAQACELAKVPAEQQVAVWEKATSNGKPTAEKVAAVVAEVVAEQEEEDEWPVVDASPEDRMAEWNAEVDKFARSITELAKHTPLGGWWDENQANIVKQQLKSAAGSARQAKCDNICPKCKGEGCKWCKQTGFMPKRSYEMAGGK
jgi:hypothetical protein